MVEGDRGAGRALHEATLPKGFCVHHCSRMSQRTHQDMRTFPFKRAGEVDSQHDRALGLLHAWTFG